VSSSSHSFELDVRVIPNASRDIIVGWHAGALKIKVAAQPESGKANKAVCSLLAKHLHLQKRAVCVVRGATSQTKRLQITGLNEAAIREQLPS
tara:strand:+ start:180 stop:458 length:279 start_codon:yes stop_codon:yes gene_type:complete